MPSRRKPTNFYRVILSGDVNKISLRIPNRFIRGHRKQILLNDIVLIVSDDKVWQLGWMIAGDGKLWVQKGWPEFAHHYRIDYGHSLIFKHMGKSIFHVRIFDSSSCEINYPPPSKSPKLQKEIDQIEGDDKSLKKPLIKVKKEEEIGDDKSLKKPLMVKVKKEEERGDDDDLIENDCRSMTKVIKKSHIYKMPMKKSFWKSVGINGYRKMWLKNDDGKIWQVKVRKYGEEETLYVGWFDFRKDNKMKIGDTCEFNHVKGNLIHVHVFKKPQ